MRKTISFFSSLFIYVVTLSLFTMPVNAQNWQQNNAIYNSSGIPSLTFSAPRFADLDGDDDFDLILGGSDSPPIFLENIGSGTNPVFSETGFITHDISSLEADICEFADMDGDGDLDLVAGGYNGLTYFSNTGDSTTANFVRDTQLLAGLTTGNNPIPTIADINGDGAKDLMIGLSESGEIKYFINTGTSTTPTYTDDSVIMPGIDVGLYAYPELVDPDLDGDWDLLIGRDGLSLFYYRNDGTVHNPDWVSYNSYCSGLAADQYFTTPSMVDLNGNGILDLVFGHYGGPLKYYLNTGTISTPVWTENTSVFGGNLDVGGASNPCLYDWDSDGDLDLISGFNMGDLKYFRNTGSATGPAWEADHSLFGTIEGESIYSSVAVGDIDNNGHPDLIMGFVNNVLIVYENTGTQFIVNNSYFNGISIGWWLIPRLVDMDADRDLDVVVGNDSGNLFYFENQGTLENANFVLIDDYFNGINGPSNAAPAVADYDNDGTIDILLGGISGNLIYYTNTGTSLDPVWTENLFSFVGVSVSQNATPAFGDLDGDGDLDLTIGAYDGNFSYFENRNPVVTVDADPLITPEKFVITTVFPNPFNPTTTIQYELYQRSDIQISIRDILGRMVTTLVSEEQDAGYKSLQWDASNVSSGMYFLEIRAGDFLQTKKLVLLK